MLGHKAGVSPVDWAPDSTRLITGGNDGIAKVWEISEDGAFELLTLSSEDLGSGVWGLTFSPDGDRVMASDVDITAVKVWDVSESGDAEWRNLEGAPRAPTAVAFASDDRLAATGPDASVRLWDIKAEEPDLTIPSQGPPDAFVETIEASPDGKVVAAIVEGSVYASNALSGRGLFTVPSETGIFDIAWSPDSRLLATAPFEDGVARVVDRSGKAVGKALIEEGGFGVAAVRFSPDGTRLATVGWVKSRPNPQAQRVKIWDWRRNQVIRTIRTPAETVAFDPARPRIAVANPQGGDIWSLEDGKKVAALTGETRGLIDIAYAPDGSLIAGGGIDGTVRVWDAESGVQKLVLHGHNDLIWRLDFSPDGSKLASGSADGTVRVWALNLDDLIRLAKGEVTRGLTRDECRQYLHGPCPG
jgi:WD40 repeat protein